MQLYMRLNYFLQIYLYYAKEVISIVSIACIKYKIPQRVIWESMNSWKYVKRHLILVSYFNFSVH